MILVGFVIGEKGWFDDKSRGLLAKLVTQVALPCYMLYTITQRFTATDLLKMLPALRFPALSMVILLGIATGVARIFAVRQDRRGLFISMFFNSNTIFVGLPINQALFWRCQHSLCFDLLYVQYDLFLDLGDLSHSARW